MRQQRARLRKRVTAKGLGDGDAAAGQAKHAAGKDPAAAAQALLKRSRRGAEEQAAAAQGGAGRPAQAGASARKGGKSSGVPLGQVMGQARKSRTSETSMH